MTINAIPNLLLTLMGLALLLAAIIALVRRVIARDLGRYFGKALREIVPMGIYPTFYMLILLARMIALTTGKYTSNAGLSFMALNQICSMMLPLSLLVRPKVHRMLFSKNIEEKEALVPYQSSN
eukprot:Em0022g652a